MFFITGGPGTNLCAGERGKVKDLCQGILLAAACVDKPDHLTLVNAARYAGDEEVLSQEEGEREGGAAEGEGGRCCCALAYTIPY